MTKEEATALILRARIYIGQVIIYNNIQYTFVDTSMTCNGEEGKLACKVYGLLKADGHPDVSIPLEQIVAYFEKV